MRQFRLTTLARSDLEEIRDYIAQDSSEAAERLLDKLLGKCRFLAKLPLVGQPRDQIRPGLRCFPAGRYVIYYVPVEDGIAVVRVIHGARDVDAISFETDD